jgi:hypothetical protein
MFMSIQRITAPALPWRSHGAKRSTRGGGGDHGRALNADDRDTGRRANPHAGQLNPTRVMLEKESSRNQVSPGKAYSNTTELAGFMKAATAKR